MTRSHFIFDCETLGQDVFTLPVLDFSYLIFDWDRFTSDNPYRFDELLSLAGRTKLKVSEQFKMGYIPDESTKKWWMSQGESAKKVLLPSNEDVTIAQFMDNILEYLGDTKIHYWWSRANTFDPIILNRLARDAGGDYSKRLANKLKFWLVRDTRTFIDSYTNFNSNRVSFMPLENEQIWNEKFVHHSSKHDIVGDVLRLQTLVRVNGGLSLPE